MKLPNLISILGVTGILLSLSACVPIDPAMLGGGGGSSYSQPQHRYNSGGYDDHSQGGGYNQGYHQAQHGAHDDHGHNDHQNHSNRGQGNYFGGPAEWHRSGYMLGKRDRKNGESCNYGRHRSQYDSRTKAEFAEGYDEGYHGR